MSFVSQNRIKGIVHFRGARMILKTHHERKLKKLVKEIKGGIPDQLCSYCRDEPAQEVILLIVTRDKVTSIGMMSIGATCLVDYDNGDRTL